MDLALLHVVVTGQEFDATKHLMRDVASGGGARVLAICTCCGVAKMHVF